MAMEQIKLELVKAVNEGETGKVQDLLKDPGALEAFKSLCQAPDSEVLDTPCKRGYEQLVKILLDHGARLNPKTEMDVLSFLMYKKRSRNIISLLIKYHKDWEALASKILDAAIERRRIDLAVEIINSDTGFLSDDQKCQALKIAMASYSREDEAKILVDKFVASNIMDEKIIESIFANLVDGDCSEAFELILKTSEDKETLAKKALPIAFEECGLKIIELLLKFDIGFFTSDDKFKAFQMAVYESNCEILKILVDRGSVFDYVKQIAALPSDLKIPDNTSIKKCIKMVKDFSKKQGADSDEERESDLNSAMYFLIENCEFEVIRELLSQAYLNAHQVSFPAIATEIFRAAIVEQETDIVELLIDYDNRTRFLTAKIESNLLNKAATYENIPSIKLLLSRRVVYLEKFYDMVYLSMMDNPEDDYHREVNTVALQLMMDYFCDKNGIESINTMSIVDEAVVYMSVPSSAVEILLSYGANINSEHGWYLFERLDHYFYENNDHVIAKLLVEHVVDELAEGRLIKQEHLEKIESIEVLRDYKKQCEGEMDKVKIRSFIGTDLSLFDVWKSNLNQRTAYLRNRNIAKALEPDKLREDFPIYADRIILRLNRGFERKFRIGRVCNFFKSLSTRKEHRLPNLPATCVNQIFSYLRNRDLYNLRAAYYN